MSKREPQSLSRRSSAIKAKITAAGISLTDIAIAADLAVPTVSNYIAGRRCAPETQDAIRRAWNELTGRRESRSRFWGPLARREVA